MTDPQAENLSTILEKTEREVNGALGEVFKRKEQDEAKEVFFRYKDKVGEVLGMLSTGRDNTPEMQKAVGQRDAAWGEYEKQIDGVAQALLTPARPTGLEVRPWVWTTRGVLLW